MPTVLTVIYYVLTAVSVAYSISSGIKARKAAKKAEREAQERASRRNYRHPVPKRTVLYGEVNTGGPFLYIDNPADKVFLSFIKMASHEVEGFLRVALNEEVLNMPAGGGAIDTDVWAIFRYDMGRYTELAVGKAEYDGYPTSPGFDAYGERWQGKVEKLGSKYAGKMWIYPVYGTEAQDVGSLLTSLGATNIAATDYFRGVAGLVVKTYKLTKSFPDISPNWNALVRGRKVFTKAGVVEWSNNVAECARDYLENFNQSELTPLIDDASWVECVDDCAEALTTVEGVVVPRYTLNGIVISDEEHREVLNQMQLAMAGAVSYAGDRWFFRAGVWKGEELEYEASEVLREIEVTLEGRSADIPTAAKAKLTSALHNWSQVESPVQEFGAVGEKRVDLDLQLDHVTFIEQAQRICRIEGQRGRRESGAVLQFGPRGLMVRPGTVARYTLPMMESAGSALYEVVDFERRHLVQDDGKIYETTHTIRTTGEADYLWVAETMEKTIAQGDNNLSSNDGCNPTTVSFIRTDVVSDPGPPVVDGSTSITASWTDPTCPDKDIIYVRVTASLDGNVQEQDISAGVGVADFQWLPESLSPVTMGARAYFDDGTNSGNVIGAEV